MLLPNKRCFDLDALYWLSTSSGVKITQQGFLFLDSPVIFSDPSYPCPRALNSLCQFENYTFLPCTDMPLTMVTDAPPPFDQFWRNEASCSKLPSLFDFHITSCDLQKGTSIVWSDGLISIQHDTDMNYWLNLFSLLIMTWLIINLGETIALIMEVGDTKPHNHSTVLLSVILVTLIVAGSQESVIWATYEDLTLYWCTVGYILLYCLYHLNNPNTINIIVGCLVLISARFYQTNETPYVATFLFLISTRLTQKACHSLYIESGSLCGSALFRYIFMAADVAFFVLMYLYAFIPAHKEPVAAHLYLLGILFSSILLGLFIECFIQSKREAKLSNQ